MTNTHSVPIGFSTGCAKDSGLSFTEIVTLYLKSNATAIELLWATAEDLETFELTSALKSALSNFDFISLHAPWKAKSQGSGLLPFSEKMRDRVLNRLFTLYEEIPQCEALVIHPDVVDLKWLKQNSDQHPEIRVALENMDHRKLLGVAPGWFEELFKTENLFRGVIDLQHVFEYDSTMETLPLFIGAFGERLSHYHVSGEKTNENHVMVHIAENIKQILGAISQKRIPRLPIILEGRGFEFEVAVLKQELAIVSNAVRFSN